MLVTSSFACSGGVCEVGPGNVGVSFAAGMIVTGGPAYYGPECNPYVMKVVSGSLPPGLVLAEPGCEWTIASTPAHAGTYAFTVQIAPQPNNLGQSAGPSGTQQLTHHGRYRHLGPASPGGCYLVSQYREKVSADLGV